MNNARYLQDARQKPTAATSEFDRDGGEVFQAVAHGRDGGTKKRHRQARERS